ncbi:hypothetical protein [Pedobacter foliorum]|uniref:hypothetical protein n=1 Tax=Pedobacter foliorum TaxID=2739058 RepID=UPI0015642634|nr:hypothetical protein [Pedobacter foliorum]NRF37496.1 hypothetical protein [Pedobacter foliorum]
MTNSIIPNPKECRNCSEKIIFGRTDKIYCTEACRIDYNNKVKMEKRGEDPEFIKKISRILTNNHQILRKLNTNGKTIVREQYLIDLGFNFHYQTSYQTTKKGDVYHFCFDQGYLKIKDNQVLLVVQQYQTQL